MWRKWGKTSFAILGGVAALVAVSVALGVYPIGIIVLLAIALTAALSVAWVQHRQSTSTGESPAADPGARRHDARIVAEVRALVSREHIEWLRTWDFGASWQSSSTNPFFK